MWDALEEPILTPGSLAGQVGIEPAGAYSAPLMYLAELRGRSEPIRVGVVGIGRMGRGVVDQVATMPGMRVMAAADVDLGRAEACLRENGADPLVTDELGHAQDALSRGRPVATGDANLMSRLALDVSRAEWRGPAPSRPPNSARLLHELLHWNILRV
jgi:hypothetical protein